jgi:hypothetical protein
VLAQAGDLGLGDGAAGQFAQHRAFQQRAPS